MIVTIHNRQKDLRFSLSSLRELVPFLLERLTVSTDEVIIHFVSDRAMRRIHAEFFNDPSSTDCMSFPMDGPSSLGPGRILGEIFVCPKVALEYAKEKEGDPHEETLLYVVHGLLHLIGYDDLEPSDRKAMRSAEKKCLRIVSGFSLKK